MLQWVSTNFGHLWGPLRLLESYFFLAASGFFIGAISTWWALPKFWHLLPRDQGRAFAVGAEKSVGKPVSAGVIFISIFCLLSLILVPTRLPLLGIVGCTFFAMLIGYYDDNSGGLHEYTLAILDFVLAAVAVFFIDGLDASNLWLPFLSDSLQLHPAFNFVVSTSIVWIAINALNCTDGVDGLSGSLSSISLLFLALLLYLIVGNTRVAEYLLIPHDPLGASWSLLAIIMTGCICGYLWYNAPPSQVLMGDAGSRPIGFLLGVLVVASNNPFVIFMVSTVILINGATGLFKVAFLRFFKIGLFRNIRFPLHDHCRKNLSWSNAQVLLRFILLHIVFSTMFLALVLKIR